MDVAVRAVEFADILGEVPAVGVPGAVLLDGRRAGGGGRDTGGILLRERNTTDRHRLGSDGTGGHRTVLHSFRASTIHRPLRGSQATFADKNRFRLQRARKLRDELLLHAGERLAGGIVTCGGGRLYTPSARDSTPGVLSVIGKSDIIGNITAEQKRNTISYVFHQHQTQTGKRERECTCIIFQTMIGSCEKDFCLTINYAV